jgi:hypothetical protein
VLIKTLVFGLLAAVLLLSYSPVWRTDYASADDFSVLAHRLLGMMAAQQILSIAGGRPTDALLTSFALAFVNRIEDLRCLRLVSVIGITLLAWSLCQTLRKAGWDIWASVSLALIICTMPAFQQYAAWVVLAFAPFAALCAGGAVSFAEQSFAESRRLRKWTLAAGASLLELIALTIYQPAAMFFWVFAALVLFKPGRTLPDFFRRVLWHGSVMGVGLVLGFATYKLGLAFYGHKLAPLRSALVTDVVEKIYWFIHEPLLTALNLANLVPRGWLAGCVALFITGGLAGYFQGTAKERLGQSLVAFFFLPLSYLPNLVVAESWASYRTQVALTSLLVVYVCFALWSYGQMCCRLAAPIVLRITLGFAALSACLGAAYNVHAYFTAPLAVELTFLREYLTQQNLATVRHIYVIGSRPEDSLAPAVRYDDFGLPFSSRPWGAWSAIYVVLREINPEHANFSFETVLPDDPIQPRSDALVVDMSRLLGTAKGNEGR